VDVTDTGQLEAYMLLLVDICSLSHLLWREFVVNVTLISCTADNHACLSAQSHDHVPFEYARAQESHGIGKCNMWDARTLTNLDCSLVAIQ